MRRNADPTPRTSVPLSHDGETPDLPEHPQADKYGDWHPATKRWYGTIRGFRVAAHFAATDWEHLFETALLHDAVMRGQLRLMGELRLRTAKMGYTVEHRRRLNMTSRRPRLMTPGTRSGTTPRSP